MPTAPKRLCQYCRKATGCDCHKKVRQEYDRGRGSSHERGYDAAWIRFRKAFVAGTSIVNGQEVSNTLCRDCLKEGRVVLMDELHHIEKVRDNPSRRLDPDNCLPLCTPHHSIRTRRGE